MKILLKQIAGIVNGELIGENIEIAGVSINTRTINAADLYIALPGKNFDGHQFTDLAKEAGASAVLVEHSVNTKLPQIIVKDSRVALAEIASFWRNQLKVKVVAITGSNGKTTVKEMIAAILSQQGNTLSTKGNLNNDIGVPLTLLNLTNDHQFAVIEMGANHPGEIAYSSRYTHADIALITNVGAAHIEGFGSLDGVATSKGEIISNLHSSGTAVLNQDDQYFSLWMTMAENLKTVSFGLNTMAMIRAENINMQLSTSGFATQFRLLSPLGNIDINLQLAGKHNVINALAAAAVALEMGVDLAKVKLGLEQLMPVTGRMQVLTGRKGNIVIDDTYNANPNSLLAALQVLPSQNENWLILGDFGELGPESPTIHRQLAEMIKSMPVQRLFAVGELTQQTVEAFGLKGQFFYNQEQLIATLNNSITGKETLLIKGSRSQKMENVVAALVDNYRAS